MLELIIIFFVNGTSWDINLIDSPDGNVDCGGTIYLYGCTSWKLNEINVDMNNLHQIDKWGYSLFDHEYKHATENWKH